MFSVSFLLPVSAAQEVMNTRDDFAWGINAHHRGYAAYPEKNVKEHVRLAAAMGCKLYRFNLNPAGIRDLLYLDDVLREVQRLIGGKQNVNPIY